MCVFETLSPALIGMSGSAAGVVAESDNDVRYSRPLLSFNAGRCRLSRNIPVVGAGAGAMYARDDDDILIPELASLFSWSEPTATL